MSSSEQSADAAAWRADLFSESDADAEQDEPDSSAEAQNEPRPEPDSEAQDADESVPPADATPDDEPDPPAEPDSGATPPGTPADEPDTGEVSASTDQPKQPEPGPKPEPKLEPFSTRVDSTDVRIPGAWTANGHVVMPTAVFDQYVRPRMVANRLALKRGAEEEGRKKGRQEAVEQHPFVQRAKTVLEQVDALKRAGPDATAEWAARFLEELPTHEARAEAELWRTRATQTEEADRGRRSEAEAEELEHAKDLALREYIGEALGSPDVQPYGLSADEIYEALRWDRRLYTQADQDYPQAGVRAGDEIVNFELFRHVIGSRAAAARRTAETRETAKKAAEKNRETLGKTNGAAVAPVVAPAGAGQGAATRAPDDPKNIDEWRAGLLGISTPRGEK